MHNVLVKQPNGCLSNQYWILASLIRKIGYMSLHGKNKFLTPANDWIHECIRDWHPGMDTEVGYSLEYEYSVTQFPPGDYIYVNW